MQEICIETGVSLAVPLNLRRWAPLTAHIKPRTDNAAPACHPNSKCSNDRLGSHRSSTDACRLPPSAALCKASQRDFPLRHCL